MRQVIDWLIESFDPRRFPWFRDDFVHPKAFPYVDRSEPLFNMNWHFAEDDVPSFEFSSFVVISGGR